MAQCSSENRSELETLARHFNVPLRSLPPKLAAPKTSPDFKSDHDGILAEEILSRHKASKTYGKPLLKTKAKMANYHFKIATLAMKEAIETNMSAGILQCLAERSPSLDRVTNPETRVSQARTRMEFVQSATYKGNLDLVRLFAPLGDDNNLNKSLDFALSENSLDIAEILLQFGADPNSCPRRLETAIESENHRCVELLLRSPKDIAGMTLAKCLSVAVVSRSLAATSLLARCRVDTKHAGVNVLEDAVKVGRLDLTLAILLAEIPPSVQQLDACIGVAFNLAEASNESKYILIKVLLCAGAQGSVSAATLVKATQLGRCDLVTLFVSHQISVNYDKAAAVRFAVSANRLDILKSLLVTGTLATRHASSALAQIPLTLSQKCHNEIMDKLISAGASRTPLDDRLVDATRRRWHQTVLSLLHANASVDHGHGAALKVAIDSAQLDILAVLLKHGPSSRTLQELVPLVQQSSVLNRLSMTEMILHAGAQGVSVAMFLRDAVSDRSHSRDEALIEMLIDGGADPAWNSGESLRIVTAYGDLHVLLMLLKRNVSTSVISGLVPIAMGLDDLTLRRKVIEALLLAGAAGDDVSEAICSALKWIEDDFLLLDLLASSGKADLDYRSGQALHDAVLAPGLRILDLFLRNGDFSNATIAQSLSTIINLENSDPERIEKLIRVLRYRQIEPPFSNALLEEINKNFTWSTSPRICSHEVLLKLLQAGASINHLSGKSVSDLTRAGAIPALKLLLSYKPAQLTLLNAFPIATRLENSKDRLEACCLLLNAGAEGVVVHQALVEMSRQGSVALDLFKVLLEHGADVNFKDGEAIRATIENDSEEMLKVILQQKPSSTVLLSAFRSLIKLKLPRDRSHRLMELLLEAGTHGVDVDNYLVTAVAASDFATCKSLLRYEVSIAHASGRSVTLATDDGNLDILQLLLGNTDKSLPVLTAVHNALITAVTSANLAMCRLLLEHGASVNHHKGEAITIAVEKDHVELVQMLLAKAEISTHTVKAVDDGLITAVTNSNLIMCKILLSNGASINHKMARSITIAAKNGSLELLQVLLESDRSLTKSKAVHEALIGATVSSNIEMCRLLLGHGALVSHDDGKAITLAARSGNLAILQGLLEADKSKPPMAVIHETLILGAVSSNLEMCEVLLKHGASVNHRNGEAASTAAETGKYDLLRLLLGAGPDKQTLTNTFKAGQALRGEKRHRVLETILKADMRGKELDSYLLRIVESESDSIPLIDMLLRSGASVHYKNDLCMTKTAVRGDFQTFKLLGDSATDTKAFPSVMQKVVDNGSVWHLPDGLKILRFLLERGACGQALDVALIQVVEHYKEHPSASALVDLLLCHGAAVNFNEGYALQLACKLGDESLIQRILLKEPSQDLKFNAVPFLLGCKVPDDQLAGLIDLFMTTPPHQSELGLLRTSRSVHILKESLKQRPVGVQTLQTLIKYGCCTEGPKVDADRQVDDQTFSVLIWAIAERHRKTSMPCFSALINAAGNLNFRDSANGKTPLMAAIEVGRYDVAEELVLNGADTSTRTDDGKSHLFFAASKDYGLVRTLVKAGVARDDGSLQEASRRIQVDVVKCLLQADHDPNHPSLLHKGRGALGELCLKANTSANSQEQVVATIEALVDSGADLEIRELGKPLLFLALDNQNPYPITEALLKSVMWRHINEKFNLCIVDRMVYSPTMYITKCKAASPERDALLRLLQRSRATDVYYATTGTQPSDAKGMPAHIVEAERARKEHEAMIAEQKARHETQLAEGKERHERQLAEEKERHERRLQEERERHESRLREEREQEIQAQALAKKRYDTKMQRDKERAKQAEEAQRLKIRLAEEATQKQFHLKQKSHQAELEYKRKEAGVQKQALKSKLDLEKEHKRTLIEYEVIQRRANAAIDEGFADYNYAGGNRSRRHIGSSARRYPSHRQIGWVADEELSDSGGSTRAQPGR